MARQAEPDFVAILRTLTRHEVDFIVVGGVCAVLHGAPLSTFHLDLVHSRKPDNIHRLLTALDALDAHSRIQPERKARPGVSHLSSPGPQLLMTRFGPLDLLGTIGAGREYKDLEEHTIEMRVDRGIKVRVLKLDSLIRIKSETAGEKDKAALPLLRRTLEEKSRG
ncbi:MAG: hypothetical protein HY238_11380 [Acidobacteria bacterium]|nr:hypothetical protein [Acidobacteriota bacterium]